MIIVQPTGTSTSSGAIYYGFGSAGGYLCGPTTPMCVMSGGNPCMGQIQLGEGMVMDASMGLA